MPANDVSPVLYTAPPSCALLPVNVASVNATVPSALYNAPPFSVAVLFTNVLFNPVTEPPSTYIAPPLPAVLPEKTFPDILWIAPSTSNAPPCNAALLLIKVLSCRFVIMAVSLSTSIAPPYLCVLLL